MCVCVCMYVCVRKYTYKYIGFGETDVFETVQVGVMKKLQERAQKIMGVAVPIFHGRGVFNKAFGLLPFRRAVNIVVGRPVFFICFRYLPFFSLFWSAFGAL